MSGEHRTGVSQTPAEWIGCCSTVYVSDPAEELPVEHGPRTDLPQFSSSGLDRSYFERLHTILSGRTEFEIAREYASGGAHRDAALRRLRYGLPIPYERSVFVFVCSEELCRSIATIDAARATDIARRWRTLLWPSIFPEGSGSRSDPRFTEAVLLQLSTLAQAALAAGKSLLVRVEYRRRWKDPVTGSVLEATETRH